MLERNVVFCEMCSAHHPPPSVSSIRSREAPRRAMLSYDGKRVEVGAHGFCTADVALPLVEPDRILERRRCFREAAPGFQHGGKIGERVGPEVDEIRGRRHRDRYGGEAFGV